jgi:multicomponent Na+:H+ antiporter subunit D
LIFIIGACLVPFLKGKAKQTTLLLIPVIAFLDLLNMPEGAYWVVNFLDHDLTFGKVDRLSLVFGYMFTITAFIGILYALRVKDDGQHVAALIYVGSALGAVFAGDLLSLFVFLEIGMLTSTYLIWARRTPASYAAGLRYLLVHLFGGLCLLIGIVIHVHQTGSIELGVIGLNGLGSYLILLGFGINCGFPILHAWLPDAYPEATITGTIFLSIFTTKTAVYLLVRTYPGTEALIWIGVAMAVFPIFYAVIENNMRRVLCYSLINQVGFMVVGIGIGTELSLNGTVSHAFTNILFEALLFLCMGAVMLQTGKVNATDMGGLYKTMPITTIFCIIGAASISGVPLFSGFVSKSMILEATGFGGLMVVWLMLLFASAGVFHHAGIKIPFFAFFSHDSGIRTTEPPLNMLLAMGIAAFLCVAIGIFPAPLYSVLPYAVDFEPYTAGHVVNQLQLLFFSALAFCLLILAGIYPAEIKAANIDADWFYRKGGKLFVRLANRFVGTDRTDQKLESEGG